MYDTLINKLEQFAHLTSDDKEIVKSIFVPYNLIKKDYFLREGAINRKVGFLLKGLVYYYIIKDGEERIVDFSSEGDFVTEFQTFIAQENATINIKAIEDSEFLIISYENLQKFYGKASNGDKVGRLVLENRFLSIVNQLEEIILLREKQLELTAKFGLSFVRFFRAIIESISKSVSITYLR